MSYTTINPATGEIIDCYAVMSDEEVESVISSTHSAYSAWRCVPISERQQLMLALANVLRERRQQCALLITAEMGKTLTSAKAEVEKCAWLCESYVEQATAVLQDNLVETGVFKSCVSYQSLGIVFGIMPWNYPFWQVFRYLVPNILAGNAVLLKHAPITTGSARLIEELLLAAGFPLGLFRVLVIQTEQVGAVINDKRIIGITLTGSVQAGRAVAAQAGAALKPCVMELGGNDPCLILADADIKKAAEVCVKARMVVSGQVCISPKRVIVVRSVYEEFKDHVINSLACIRYGDPLSEDADMGPLARADLRDQLHQQVLQAITDGATLLMGGEMPKGNGFYYPPTLLDAVTPGSIVFNEELFGPVVSLVVAQDESHAVSMANDSEYGLGATVFTCDRVRAEKIARSLQVGCCYVNTNVSSHPLLPFGGIKNSGFGRELGQEGLLAFVNHKTISIC